MSAADEIIVKPNSKKQNAIISVQPLNATSGLIVKDELTVINLAPPSSYSSFNTQLESNDDRYQSSLPRHPIQK